MLRKGGPTDTWDDRVPRGAYKANARIIRHINLFPASILFGNCPEPTVLTNTILRSPRRGFSSWKDLLWDEKSHAIEVESYIRYGAETHDAVAALSRRQKEADAARFGRGDAHH